MIKRHKKYWDDEATKFDAIYTGKKSSFFHLLDKIFRKDMIDRLNFTIQESEPIKGKSFLDVGCGSGRYCLELAIRNAKQIVGIDISPKMIDIAREIIKDKQLDTDIDFFVGELFDYKSEEIFDITIAIGFFDYIEQPVPLLKKMREFTREKVILSFPRINTWRAPLRKIRLLSRGYVVYFFTKNKIRNMMKQAGFSKCKIVKIGKLYCVVGYCN